MELAQYHLVNWTSSNFIREELRIGREETNVSILALGPMKYNFFC